MLAGGINASPPPLLCQEQKIQLHRQMKNKIYHNENLGQYPFPTRAIFYFGSALTRFQS